MKLNFGKPKTETQKRIEEVAAVTTGSLQLRTQVEDRKAYESAKASAEAGLQEKKDAFAALSKVQLPKKEVVEQPAKPINKLNAIMQNKPAQSAQIQNLANTPIPQLAPKTEKYVLLAEATEELPQPVLDMFAEKMQTMMSALDTQYLQHALHEVKRFTDEHKELRKILRAEDVQLFVKAARQSAGLTVVAKTENKQKASKKQAMVNELAGEINDIFANLDISI